jgi:ABC-type lipoprotein export system ATPase subunit
MSRTAHPETPRRDPLLLQAVDLRKTYRLGRVLVPVLKGASIEVRRGEWVAVLGASGSGKSTLLHLLGGLDRPDAGGGAVLHRGRRVDGLRAGDVNRYRNQAIGFVFQFYHLLPELDVLENCSLPAAVAASLRSRLHWALVLGAGALLGAGLAAAAWGGLEPWPLRAWWHWALLAGGGAAAGAMIGAAAWLEVRSLFMRFGPAQRAVRRRAQALLESFGLGHRLAHRPRELSGGERQRVAIARALMNRPQVLLADEPTGNLDERTGAGILDLIAAQHRQGLTIVMVTHDPAIAARADRVVRLHDGRVEEKADEAPTATR